MILTAITIILVSSVAFADNDCSVCDNICSSVPAEDLRSSTPDTWESGSRWAHMTGDQPTCAQASIAKDWTT